ncbi:MAG: nucleotide sugar dehydrogenase [Pseudomonadota bacterium]
MTAVTRAIEEGPIAVLGLGYVGLPLALALAKAGCDIVGFDTDPRIVTSLQKGRDLNAEVADKSLSETTVRFASDPGEMAGARVFVIAVPTPITDAKAPDLGPIRDACAAIAPHLTQGALVILESTVYPGVTEEFCGPILAAGSGLMPGSDFQLAYSPERVNPGDAEHSLSSVIKIISAQDEATLDRVEAIYASVVPAGLHRASTIMTAEAAKVIENTQRDLNIALVNEFALIFDRLGLDTLEVLEAAGTKWNFLDFKPGLVGGHCIGVDPYYLTYRAEQLGYHPEVILAGRRINDHMGAHVAQTLVKTMLAEGMSVQGARVLIMGYTFKENCADTRNTRVEDIVAELRDYSVEVDVYEPWVPAEVMRERHRIMPVDEPRNATYDAIIVAVGHRQFREMGPDAIRAFGKEDALLYDIKGVFGRDGSDLRL